MSVGVHISDQLPRLGYSVRGLANWVLDFADSVGAQHTNMGLNKLVFFALESVLVGRGALLTNARIEAWEHGPVFREVYQDFKRFGDKPVTGRASFYSPVSGAVEVSTVTLNEEDEQAIRDALTALIHKSASELRRLSHREGGAWFQVWWYDGYANPGMEITVDSIIEANEGRRN